MYYGEYQRIRRMEKFLERLAYLSVGLDFFVAVATILVIQGAKISGFILLVGGYLLFIEVVLASVIFLAMVVVKHYRKIIDGIADTTFRKRYPAERPRPKPKKLYFIKKSFVASLFDGKMTQTNDCLSFVGKRKP